MFRNLPAKLEIFGSVRLAVMPLEIRTELIDRDHGFFLRIDLPRSLFNRRQFLGQHRYAFESCRVLTDQARIHHGHMLCLATIVIAETRHLTLAMNDDSFSRGLSGKEWRFRP